MSQNLEKLKRLLAELFQFDQAELDFGIYRIMNAKRDEISRFLEQDLLPQVREAFASYETGNRGAVEAELADAIQKAKELGADPDQLPRVKELRAKLAQATDVTALENEVYSHLYNFFRRYYNEGDFISLRRYKEGVYAIPYEGEEVKLHWANRDQYYIKTSENFRDYTFKLPSGKRAHFKLVAADTERENNRAQNGNERRFILAAPDPLTEQDGELIIRFEYRPDPEKTKQADLNATAVNRILTQTTGFDEWRRELAGVRGTEKNPARTLLEKHLADYTARNTFDYFIHKDLGGFLRRELDFYIKNEVMHLDDVETETAPRVEQYLAKIRAIRRIAHKLIDFLAQIEDFQKRLWLKKKFVVETQYCVTLDRVPEALYPEIAGNEAQHQEWIRLFAIDEIEGNLNAAAYTVPVSVEFLKQNPYLAIDTQFYPEAFKSRLMATMDNLDDQLDGILVHSDNSAALRLLSSRYSKGVTAVYIDPPYNTDAGPILYKNGYRKSSWSCLIDERIALAKPLMKDTAILCATIDDYQQRELEFIIEDQFGHENLAGVVSIRSKPSGRPTPVGFSQSHEYAIFAKRSTEARIAKLPRTEAQARRYNKRDDLGAFMWELFRKRGSESERNDRRTLYYPLYASEAGLRVPEMEWNEESRDWIVKEEPRPGESVLWPIDEDGVERRWRGSWERIKLRPTDYRVERSSEGNAIVYYKYRPGMDGVIPSTAWIDAKYSATEHGTNVLNEMFREFTVFSYPKSIHAVVDCLLVSGMDKPDSVCIDYFGGSGTTGHSVVNLNRADGGRRKYILVESEGYFDRVLKPRIQKAAYSSEWQRGKPTSRDGVSHAIKYIKLESYEDALNNLELKRSEAQQSLLDQHAELREDYMLRYMLDVESRGSGSLLNIGRFDDPFNYRLNISTGTAGETEPRTLDLVETFNYLLGLRVKTMDEVRGVRVVTGLNPAGERVLILWRKVRETDNDALDAWFRKQGYNTKDQEFDVIYVNGDNNLENLRQGEQTWKVRLIDQEFQRLMFDEEGI